MLGMIGVLFIVLMIPEFWKNKSCDCMQIEATCLYSLRQIYAARIFLFGIVDLFMISLFCITLRGSVNLALSEIVIQFLFPAVVTACICFGTLCSNSRVNEELLLFSACYGAEYGGSLSITKPFTFSLHFRFGMLCLELLLFF